jgi:site-specific recombinase XerD
MIIKPSPAQAGIIPTTDGSSTESSKFCTPASELVERVIFAPITDPVEGPLSLREAVARYLTLREAEGMDPHGDTYSHLTKHLAVRLCAALGDLPIRSVKADHLRAWVAGLYDERNGRPLETLTKRHHMIATKTFFRRCWREGWIERDPTIPLVLPQILEQNVNVVAVADAFRFFKVNRDHRAIGRLALEAFGGLRYSSAGKLAFSDLKFSRRGIEMPSGKHKSKRRKFRQGQPSNMWEWAQHASTDCWKLDLRQYREDKKELLVMAAFRPMILKTDADRLKARELKNLWRHSFASYYLANKRDYAPVAYLMQHSTGRTTEIYEGMADEYDSFLYFGITPKSVLMSWEDYCASIPLPSDNPTPPNA